MKVRRCIYWDECITDKEDIIKGLLDIKILSSDINQIKASNIYVINSIPYQDLI
jgi:hypothetical protein